MSFSRILIMLDFSVTPSQVLKLIQHCVDSKESRLWIVHVEPPDPVFAGYGVGPKSVRQQVSNEFRTDHEALSGFCDSIKSAGYDVTPLLVQGPTVDVIADQCHKLDIDLIIGAYHKYGLIDKIIGGHVLPALFEKVSCPVLLAPEENKE